MLIAHLPAGYLVTRGMRNRFVGYGVNAKWFIITGVLGAAAPDLDIAYHYFLDGMRNHHHTYWTHFPIVWAALFFFSFILFKLSRSKNLSAYLLIFTINGCIHLMLDTLVGGIWWGVPFVNQPFSLFAVPDFYRSWWLNYFRHWSFALELAIAATAMIVWRYKGG